MLLEQLDHQQRSGVVVEVARDIPHPQPVAACGSPRRQGLGRRGEEARRRTGGAQQVLRVVEQRGVGEGVGAHRGIVGKGPRRPLQQVDLRIDLVPMAELPVVEDQHVAHADLQGPQVEHQGGAEAMHGLVAQHQVVETQSQSVVQRAVPRIRGQRIHVGLQGLGRPAQAALRVAQVRPSFQVHRAG